MSWLWRGFQSAVFYYVSCAPCTKFAYQRRRRKDRKRAKADREAEEGSYQHPSPFSTNIYWREEMLLGPGPPQKRKERDKGREKERENMNRGLGTTGSALTGASSADTTSGTQSREVEQERVSDEGWNRRRYQREDEILWGFVDNDRASNPKAVISRTGTTANSGQSYFARNPEVNDLHPPIVNSLTDKSQTRWMLQPPPSARVMEGKERANRSRSDSGTSGRSNASSGRNADINLARRIHEESMEEPIHQADVAFTEFVPLARTSPREIPNKDPSGQRHDRDRSVSDASRSTNNSHRKRPPPLITISADLRPAALRPPLSTITSQTNIEEAAARPPRPILLPTDSTSSLHVLQELVSPLSLSGSPTGKFNISKLNTVMRSPSPLSEAAIKLPPATSCEDQELALPGNEHQTDGRDGRALLRKENYEMPTERKRWSMDI